MTTAGLSAGIDGALHLVEKLDGRGWAKAIAYGIEYDWQPDAGFARASLADVKLPNSLGDVLTRTSVPVDMHGTSTQWQEKWIVSTDVTAADVLAGLEKNWAKETGWEKTSATAARTNWMLKEKAGPTWDAWAMVDAGTEKGKVLVTFGIAAREKAGAGKRSNGR
jgi:hypothetical protein